ncbi:hypothetical protein IWW38_005679, partial [Coemansia aciculifera]
RRMDVLNQYGSGVSDDDGHSSDDHSHTFAKAEVRQYSINTAPDISGHAPSVHELTTYVGLGQREIRYNMPYEVLAQPLAGPSDSDGDFASHTRGMRARGQAEAHAVSETSFRQQERQFRQTGNNNNSGLRRKSKGQSSIVAGDGAYQGPWAGYEDDTKGVAAGPTAEQLAEYEQRVAQHTEAEAGETSKVAKSKRGPAIAYTVGEAERTKFHGQSERDYQGRTYMHVPTELRQTETPSCFVPKRMVKEWRGAHAGGVSAIRFIPDSGHLLLSSGMDGQVKIFDTHSSLSLLRTYTGHSKAVRNITFAPSGTSFLSSSYDTFTKLWDTETGQCLQRFSAKGRVPYVAKFYPEDPNIFLVGQGDKKIVQWDIRANEIVQ